MLKFRNILVWAGLLILVAMGGIARAADGAPAVLTGERDAVAVARHMSVLVDPEGGWDFQAVRDRFASRFQANHSDALNFGFTGSVIWLRFAVDARGVAGEDWYLVERYPILDHITLFAPLPDGGYRRVDMGDTLPFDHRLMKHRAFIFPLDTSVAADRDYFVRVSGKGALNMSPMLYSASGLVEYTYRDLLVYGIFYGCLLIMVVYNALLALSLKEPVYLYFVAFLVGITVFNLNVNGFGLQFLWPSVPKLNEYYWLGIFICTPALAMYSRHFLSLKERFPRYDRLIRGYLLGVALLLPVQLLVAAPWSYYLSTLLVVVTVLLFSWLGWTVWSAGYRAARLYVAAWFVFLGLIFVFVLGNLDWIPYDSLISMLPHLGALWVVVMLSLALGDRIRFLEQERNLLARQSRDTLERHLAEIEQMNRDKSTFLQYVSHELNTPINWIGAADSLGSGDDQEGVWQLVRKGQKRLIGMVSTSLRYFDLADRDRPPAARRCRPGALLDALLASRAGVLARQGLTVNADMDADLTVLADEGELGEVLGMALDNAIRFGGPGGSIEVTGRALAGEAQIRVRDHGRGAGPDQLESLFEPFFVVGSRHHEEGYGLSLAMARVMIEQAGGRIWAESDGPDTGFALVIRLPLA
ncbi:sensor histidine kinase [Alcanivorax marinus]|uniref:histidine kinase n=1 Tax=Alloalcanivorax marinus TaxID=1177169 RepID=A0A9Q3YR90_9GAMM|nr:sensor histidine kinase [Alloalcanivorax marinus]MCC4308373.1 sensor histidine kinase [Alloalcanivorax marinus]